MKNFFILICVTILLIVAYNVHLNRKINQEQYKKNSVADDVYHKEKILQAQYDKPLFESLVKASQDFPSPPDIKQKDIENPDVDIAISQDLIRSLIQSALKSGELVIPLDKESPDENFFIVKKLSYLHKPQKASIVVDVGGSARYEKLFVVTHPTLKNCSLTLTPKISKSKDGKFFLSVFGTVTNLDVKYFPTKYDKILANIVTRALQFSDDGTKKPFTEIDLTKFLKPKIEAQLLGKNIDLLPMTDAAIVFEDKIMHFKAKI